MYFHEGSQRDIEKLVFIQMVGDQLPVISKYLSLRRLARANPLPEPAGSDVAQEPPWVVRTKRFFIQRFENSHLLRVLVEQVVNSTRSFEGQFRTHILQKTQLYRVEQILYTQTVRLMQRNYILVLLKVHIQMDLRFTRQRFQVTRYLLLVFQFCLVQINPL